MSNRLKLAIITGLVAVALALPAPVSAHNAAHKFKPSGECLSVAAGNTVQLPPTANAPQNNGELDLIPGSGDQFGARFAVTRGNTPLLAGHCP